MKTKFFVSTALAAVAAVSVIVVSCQKEAPDLLDLDMAQITMMTPAQQAVFDEATKRIDKHISFDADAGQYVMGSGLSAAKVGLSDRFFDYFKRNFEATNVQLKQMQGQGYVAVQISGNRIHVVNPDDGFDMPTKVISEFEKGGINDWEMRWYGVDVYLSNQTLQDLSSGSGIAGTILGKYPYAAAVLGVMAGVNWVAYRTCPNGVVLSVTINPITLTPTVFWVEPQ